MNLTDADLDDPVDKRLIQKVGRLTEKRKLALLILLLTI